MTTTTLTTAQKIEAIEASGLELAFDNCHKIYVLRNDAEIAEAEEATYSVIPANEIRSAIMSSCGLVFVSQWSLEEHDWNIGQSTEDIFDAAEESGA